MPCFDCFGASPVEDAAELHGNTTGTPLKTLSPPNPWRAAHGQILVDASTHSGSNQGLVGDQPGSFHGNSGHAIQGRVPSANPPKWTPALPRGPSTHHQGASHLNPGAQSASDHLHRPSEADGGSATPKAPVGSGLQGQPMSPGRGAGPSGLAGTTKGGFQPGQSDHAGQTRTDGTPEDSRPPPSKPVEQPSRQPQIKRKTIKSSPPEGQEWRDWKGNPASEHYDFVKVLGGGAFADVILGVHKSTNKHHALKVVYLKNPTLRESHITVLQREGQYLQMLQHKNIVRCHKVYKASTHWVFVLEYLKGGMLLNDLSKLKRYSEKTAAAVFRQILHAVNYLHERKIVHRDIKPDNVVFKTQIRNSSDFGKDSVVKLVDFGMLLDLSKEPQMKGIMGSPGYVAPEVGMGHHHSTQMDCYSLGVMLFVMLVGSKPMSQDQVQSMKYAWMQPEQLRNMHEPQWKMLSDPARDLVLQLLQPDPERRATVKLALNHRWIKGAREDSVLDGSVMEGWADPGHVMPPPWMASRLHSNLNYAPWAAAAAAGGMQVQPGTSGMPMSPQAGHQHPGFQPGAPMSPVGAHGNTVFTPTHGQHMHTHMRPGGTPTGDMTGRSGPFGHAPGWGTPQGGEHMTGGGLSAPLANYGQPGAAAMSHDELMRKAHEKLIESERNFKVAHAILTQGGMAADGHSGLIGMDGHLSGHGASFGQSMVPASPHSSSKRLSGNLMPEGSYEQSLFAQGHSTNAGSTGGASQRRIPASRPTSDPQKEFQIVEDNIKDANRMIAELDQAPSLRPSSSRPATSSPALPTSTPSSSHDPLLAAEMLSAQMSTQLSGPASSIQSDLSNPGDKRVSGSQRHHIPDNSGSVSPYYAPYPSGGPTGYNGRGPIGGRSMGGGGLPPSAGRGNMGGYGKAAMGGGSMGAGSMRPGSMGTGYGMAGRGSMGGSMGGGYGMGVRPGSMGGGGIPGRGMQSAPHAGRGISSSQRHAQGVVRGPGRQNLSASMGAGVPGRGGPGAAANMSGSMGGGYGRPPQGSMGGGGSRSSSASPTKAGVSGRGSVRQAGVRTPSHSRATQPSAAARAANTDPDDPNAYYGAPLQPAAPISNKSMGTGGRKVVRSKIDTGLRNAPGSVGGTNRRTRTGGRT